MGLQMVVRNAGELFERMLTLAPRPRLLCTSRRIFYPSHHVGLPAKTVTKTP